MDVLGALEDVLNSQIAGVLIGGVIGLFAQCVAARTSLREQKRLLFVSERVQHYYRINDLLFELDEALSLYAGAAVRPGEDLSEEELRNRDQQGVAALDQIFGLKAAIRNEGKKVRVIGSGRVALQLESIIDTLDTLLISHAENAIHRNGLFSQSLHNEHVAKIAKLSESMVRLMHEELRA